MGFSGGVIIKLYAVAVQCEERKEKSTRVSFDVIYAVAINKNEAIGIGIQTAKNTWPKSKNHQCVVEEIPNEVLMEVLND